MPLRNLAVSETRKGYILVSGVMMFASPALAQNQNPPANPGPNNPAVKRTEGNNPGAPVAGANSFTEGQAKSRIESSGYTNVTALKKDDAGVWRGKAEKDGNGRGTFCTRGAGVLPPLRKRRDQSIIRWTRHIPGETVARKLQC